MFPQVVWVPPPRSIPPSPKTPFEAISTGGHWLPMRHIERVAVESPRPAATRRMMVVPAPVALTFWPPPRKILSLSLEAAPSAQRRRWAYIVPPVGPSGIWLPGRARASAMREKALAKPKRAFLAIHGPIVPWMPKLRTPIQPMQPRPLEPPRRRAVLAPPLVGQWLPPLPRRPHHLEAMHLPGPRLGVAYEVFSRGAPRLPRLRLGPTRTEPAPAVRPRLWAWIVPPLSTLSWYTQIAQGVEGLLAGLGVAGVQTALLKFPTDRPAAGVVLPSQQITLGPASEQPTGSLNDSNDWNYPLLLTFMQPCDQDQSWDTNFLAWRRRVELALHNKRPLPGIVTNPYFRVDPRVVVDPGTVHDQNLAIGQLLVWAWQREARPAPPAATALTGDPFVYASVGQAVQAAIQSLDLPYVAEVLLLKTWSDRVAIQVDLSSNRWVVLVATGQDPEREVGPMNYRDDWVWPVLVSIVRASDQNLAWDDPWFLARQNIRDAFHNQRLRAVPTVWKCVVEPRAAIDPGPFHDQNVDIGQLLVRCYDRERRY